MVHVSIQILHQNVSTARVNMASIRPQPQVHERRPMPFFSPRYAKSKMGKKKKIEPDTKEKIAKICFPLIKMRDVVYVPTVVHAPRITSSRAINIKLQSVFREINFKRLASMSFSIIFP